MNITEIAARNRRQKMEQLQRLRPVYHSARTEREELREAKANVGVARQGLELMQKLRHIPGFFPTPPAIVEQMMRIADINPGDIILEPSAGKGNIAEALWKWGQKEASLGAYMVEIVCVEKNYQLAEHLKKVGRINEFSNRWKTHCADFLECGDDIGVFDRILMNPPFEKRQDIAHTQHAFKFLKDGGRLVSIVSSTSGTALEDWASDHGGYVEPLPAGSFATSERPTGVSCSIVVASK